MAVTSTDAARLVITFGNIVVLCSVDSRGRCSWPSPSHEACESPGKRPVFEFCPNGKDSPVTEAERAAAIYAQHPNLNIGVVLGPADLVAVDVDKHQGKPNGHLELAALERRIGTLPITVEDESGGGGLHRFYRRPKGELRKQIAPSVEMLTSGLVVVAPSTHASGQPYRWVRDPWSHEIAELPPRWVRHVTRGSVPNWGQSAAVAIDSIPASVEVTDAELLLLLDDPGPGGDVSRGDFAVARRALRLGYDDRAVAALVIDHRQRVGDPKNKADRADYITATVANAKGTKRTRVGVA